MQKRLFFTITLLFLALPGWFIGRALLPGFVGSKSAAAQAAAQTYYIDPVNGDDDAHNGTSPLTAWRTLRNVISYRGDYIDPYHPYAVRLEPGDTIYLMNGVHSAIYRPGTDAGPTEGRPAVMYMRGVNGTEAAPIRLLAYPGHHPVIDPGYQGEGLYILQSSWLEVGGIEFRNGMSQGEGGNIAISGTHHVQIYDVEVHDADGEDNGNMSGLNATGVWDLEIYNCSFHDNYDRTAADTGGISTANSTNMVFFRGGNISVHDCLIYQSPNGPDMSQVNSGMGIKYKHASDDPNAYFHVYNNVFRNNKFAAFLTGTANTHFHHNIVIGGTGGSIGSTDNGGPTHQTNQVFEYNTFYQVHTYNQGKSEGGFFLYPTTHWRDENFPNDPSQIVYRNNIVSDDLDYTAEHATINIYPYISDEMYNATALNVQFDNNCYHNPNHDLRFSFAASTNPAYGGPELGGYYTFAEWQALSWTNPSNGQTRPLAYDAHSVTADPQFLSVDSNLSRYTADSSAFRPAAASACETMGAYAGLLQLNATAADQSIYLDWTLDVTPAFTGTWQIDYYTNTVTTPFTVTLQDSTARSATSTDHIHNYQTYTITLKAMLDETAWLSDTVQVMPTNRAIYLPLALK